MLQFIAYQFDSDSGYFVVAIGECILPDYIVQKLVLGIKLPKEIFYNCSSKSIPIDTPKFDWVQLHDFDYDVVEFVYLQGANYIFVGRILHTDSTLSAQYGLRVVAVDISALVIDAVKADLDDLFDELQLEMLLPEIQLHIISIPVYN